MPRPYPVPPYLQEAIDLRERRARECSTAHDRKHAAAPGPELDAAHAAWAAASRLYTEAVMAEKQAQQRARRERLTPDPTL